MKNNKLTSTLPYILIFSAPCFLTGCEGLGNMFGGNSSPDYTYSQPAPRTTFEQNNKATKKAETTRLVEPGISTVNTPQTSTRVNTTSSSSGSATSAAAATATPPTTDGPAVPSMAPSVGQ